MSELKNVHYQLLNDLDDVPEASLHELGYTVSVVKPLLSQNLIRLATEGNRAVDRRFRITPQGRALVAERRKLHESELALG